ncbi:MAG: ABC transporter ATP-binding protein [Anaerolineales bacterium]|nr:ABC transporter ATP-binding protein [Anaerolineales bacterium]MCB9129039.1 ABC transporter ATP-binding protein [Ardenticatenales bacterium]MCB9172474.1 ABC transporter ATP-binding protein [Ardenticatenales bacterium]
MNALRRSLIYLRDSLPIAVGALLSLLAVTAANLYSPQLIRQLIDNGISVNSWRGIWMATLGLLLVAVARGLFNFLQGFWSEKSSQNVAYELRNAVYHRLATISFSYHDQHQTGQLLTRLTSDVEAVRLFYGQGLLQFLSAVITLIGSAVILFVTDWRLALASLVTIPLIGVVFGLLFGRLLPRFRAVQQRIGALNTVLQENIAGVRVVKAFAAEPHEQQRYRAANERIYDEYLVVVRLFSAGFPLVFFLANLGTLIVIWYGGNRVISGQLTLGTLIAFNTYLAFLLMPVFQLGFISQILSRASASADRLFELLDAESEVHDRPNATPLPTIEGHVAFDDVHFRYRGGTEDVLRGISFEAAPGQMVAVLGATGSGKSTIINLIPRFYDVTGGAVRIDGVDVRDATVASLRRQIGIVLQEATLVSGTIRDNIAFGVPEASDARIEAVARAAQAHDFIMAQPDGYATRVGERGVGLSGGQRQRIAIARALLVDPHILIFDDSTSAVDAETEYQIQQALDHLLAGRTAFVIAQRISTVRHADLILVLDNGAIVARGTHDELMESSPLYAEILGSQLIDDSLPLPLPA